MIRSKPVPVGLGQFKIIPTGVFLRDWNWLATVPLASPRDVAGESAVRLLILENQRVQHRLRDEEAGRFQSGTICPPECRELGFTRPCREWQSKRLRLYNLEGHKETAIQTP